MRPKEEEEEEKNFLKPMTDDPSSPSKKLVRETCTRNLDGIEL